MAKKKIVRKKGKEFSWIFPANKFFSFRGELFTIILLAVFVFLIAFYNLEEGLLYGIYFTVFFLLAYSLISRSVHFIRQVEEKYHINPTHIKIIRKTRWSKIEEKLLLKSIVFHKIDKLFHGGYILTKKGKHLLFFNTKKELEKFEKLLKY